MKQLARLFIFTALLIVVMLSPMKVAAESTLTDKEINNFRGDADNCKLPDDAVMGPVSSWVKTAFFPKNSKLKFTMTVPYSQAWAVLGKKLSVSNRVLPDSNGPNAPYWVGIATVYGGVQDPACEIGREFSISARVGSLAQRLKEYQQLKLKNKPAPIVLMIGTRKALVLPVFFDSEDGQPYLTSSYELLVQIRNTVVSISKINEVSLRMVASIQ